MKKAIIVEDEVIAAQALHGLIHDVNPGIEILAVLQSIDESVEWFQLNPMPDLVFMDIHLADGSSFAIFEEVKVTCPIIFTTAYDQYALKAFEVNSIDYLLKPIDKKDLKRAIEKYQNMSAVASTDNMDIFRKLLADIKQNERRHLSYLLVPEKDRLVPLATNDIACICIDSKMVKAITNRNTTCYLDQNLDELMQQLNPSLFFRANRQFIISREAVKDISIWFGSKLSINLSVPVSERIIVSKARVSEFKKWFAG